MLALVLSGAANFGAMQAGGIEALLKTGIKPDLVVGTSAGALNTIHVAANPSVDGMRQLRSAWEAVDTSHVGKPNWVTGLSRVILKQDSLFLSEPLAKFLLEHLPPGVDTFGQLTAINGIRAYTSAICMETSRLIIFGDQKEDRLIDGAMASTAIPPYFPPWQIGPYRYVDGGLVAKLPIRPAVERGATQIIALEVNNALGSAQTATDLFGISSYALSLMADHQTKEAVGWAQMNGVELRVIKLLAPPEVAFWDYRQAGYLYELGQQIVAQALENEPVQFSPGWKAQVRHGVTRLINRLLALPAPWSESARQAS